jgi:hypothetical protein
MPIHKLTNKILVFLKHFSQNIRKIYKIIYNLRRHGNQIWQFITLSNIFYEFQSLVGLLTFDYNFFGFSFKRCSFFSCFIFSKINSRCDNVMVHSFACSCLENQQYLWNQWSFFKIPRCLGRLHTNPYAIIHGNLKRWRVSGYGYLLFWLDRSCSLRT